ncbi:hypothetical protein Ahy_A10g050356 [Arachis hypogaea]|uniref:Protein FAR1-RELATED SEQUENCE n=1 Tax=Arachis hypogaea TaxID=3818 RepID=A0A445B965_ARAHY|nr:hypothetical protein Ahy_A10g050356 [Arachis hypogaea]
MDHLTSDCQLNPGEVDYEFESNEVPEPLSVVDDQFIPKVGMTFTTLEDAGKFYRNYAKVAGFSTRVRSTNRKGNEIKNQLITCSRERKWKSKISPTKKTNPTAGLNCPARIYIHTLKDVGAWIISKVVLDHSHPCCPSKAEMLKQHKELSLSIRRTIENNEEADIEREMSQIVFNSHSKDSFDRNWNHFLLNFGLVDNKWLSDLYEDRHIWVPIYLDHHFWAGMRSIQRSESMHSFFNKEQAERESDAADFHTVIPCATKSSIEAQFQDVYTHQKFREVQAQFRGKANCITRLTNSALGYSVYEVGEQVSSSIFNKFVVTYDSVAAEVKCQCLLFESRGILCRHALSVLSFEQVSQVSPRYILERWSKKVKRRHTHIKSSHDEPLMEQEARAKRKGTSSLSHEDVNLESVNELQSPPRIQTRGRPKNRLGSKLDKQIANAAKKKKTKVLSEINLFDAASVVHSNNRQYQGHVMNYQFTVPAAVDNSLGV